MRIINRYGNGCKQEQSQKHVRALAITGTGLPGCNTGCNSIQSNVMLK